LHFARRGPGGTFGDLALIPGGDLAAEDDPAAVSVHGDPRSIEFGIAARRILDFWL
jgi:hypothetical protein